MNKTEIELLEYMKSLAENGMIRFRLDYYGSADYGKRAYWVEHSNPDLCREFVWHTEFDMLRRDLEVEGIKVVVTE